MKKKFLGRVLTMLLVASMVFTLLPAPAIAAGNWWWNNDEYTEEAVPTATTDDYDRILHLDCGRKYFTKDWIIALMTEAKAAGYNQIQLAFGNKGLRFCSATSFLRNWDSILEKKRANLRSISEPARLRQPPPRSTGAAHARGRAQSIREERRIAAPPVLFALLWVRLLPALYGPFCGPLRPFGGCPWGVTPPARECLPPAPPDTRRRG